MKRVLYVLVLLCLCVGLAGCGNKGENEDISNEEIMALLESKGFEVVSDKSNKLGMDVTIKGMDKNVLISKVEENKKVNYMLFYVDDNLDEWIQYEAIITNGKSEDFQVDSANDSEKKAFKKQKESYISFLDELQIKEKQFYNFVDYILEL